MAKGAYIGVPKPEYEPAFADNSWRQIIKACQKNEVPSTWAVGNSKAMTINGADYLIDIIGKNHDTYADGSGTAPITFQLHDCYGTKYSMDDGFNGNLPGWTNCVMRKTNLSAIFALMPAEVQAGIKEVNKLTSVGGQNSTINTTADKLFLLSEIEVFGKASESFSGEGSQYAYYAAGNSKIKNFSGSASAWCLRSPWSGNQVSYCVVTLSGTAYAANAPNTNGVAFAFCFGGTSELDTEFPSLGSVARKIKKPYIGVGGVAHKVKKIYIGVNGIAKLCWSGGDPISLRSVGDSVYMNVNGERKEFIIVQKGNPNSSIYDASCDGVWLLMKGVYEKRAWNSSNNNSYADSTIHSYLNGDFLNLFDGAVQSTIKQVKIPYRAGNSAGNSAVTGGANGLSTKIFLPSGKEVDAMQSYAAGEGAILSYFTSDGASKRTAYLNGTATEWWLRSPLYRDSSTVCYITNNGYSSNSSSTAWLGIRPMLILPNEALVDDEGNVVS